MTPAHRPSLREQKKRETWHTIRQAAFTLISERGYDAVSVDDIAVMAHVSKSTLFNYFKTKEALLFDPDPDERAHWEHLLVARPADETLWASLEAFFLNYTGQYDTKLLLHKRLIQTHPALAATYGDSGERLTTFLLDWGQTRLREQGHDPALVPLLISAAQLAMGTAFGQWEADQDFPAFHSLIQTNFAVLGRGLLTL